jgi:hypothetical protein
MENEKKNFWEKHKWKIIFGTSLAVGFAYLCWKNRRLEDRINQVTEFPDRQIKNTEKEIRRMLSRATNKVGMIMSNAENSSLTMIQNAEAQSWPLIRYDRDVAIKDIPELTKVRAPLKKKGIVMLADLIGETRRRGVDHFITYKGISDKGVETIESFLRANTNPRFKREHL